MILESAHKRIRQATLLTLASVATLVGQSGSRAPSGRMTTAPRVEQKASPVVKKTPASSAQGENKISAVEKQITPSVVTFSIPDRPDITFSNKLAGIPLPKVPQKRFYKSAEYERIRKNDALRAASPYVPDIFYEKSKLPYAERMKFFESPEYWKIEDALREEYNDTVGKQFIHGLNLRTHIVYICRELLIYGRPLATLPTETESLREAVDICGLTQLGKWMDIQKAKNREFRIIVPDGYDEDEAFRQYKHVVGLFRMYGYDAYTQITGVSAEKPVNSDCPYYTAQDFSHLTPTQKKKLLEMLYLLPESIKNVPRSGARATWNEYEKIKADKTGYSYFNTYISKRLPKKWEKEELLEFQKLCLDMLVYGRPEALLKAKSATLERIIYTCRFRHAEDFYRRQKGSKIKEKQFDKTERMIYDREANALVTLGKKYKHSDWVNWVAD
ncbi:MAG: hypothetical protein IKQ17_01810 [Kiritimatiellae bacterium]|nr:hypothetical protein [Kiritimatiellia bacterium]